MSNRRGEFDVAHPLSANLGKRDFHATFFANNAAILHALVLTAQALIVLDRPENTSTEKTITLWFKSPVIDGLRLFDLSIRP